MIDIRGTCILGGVKATYEKLVATFGKPSLPVDGFKTPARWAMTTPTGDVVTIRPCNSYHSERFDEYHSIPIGRITNWVIGGHRFATVSVVAWVEQRLAS